MVLTALLTVFFAYVGIELVGVTGRRKREPGSSPFVDAIKSLNIPVLATIFNWIVISASVSSVDGALYTA